MFGKHSASGPIPSAEIPMRRNSVTASRGPASEMLSASSESVRRGEMIVTLASSSPALRIPHEFLQTIRAAGTEQNAGPFGGQHSRGGFSDAADGASVIKQSCLLSPPHVRESALGSMLNALGTATPNDAMKMLEHCGRAGQHGATIISGAIYSKSKGILPCALTSLPEAHFPT